ncbi:DUF6308 family protein [Streptomyces aureus]|uniref:DUF6308 family protein n=1 Tax=Streptomyces aureus TaxID=193461 RepID=UPI0033E7AEAF
MRLSGLLQAIPRDIDMVDADADIVADGSPADQAWHLLRDQPDVGWVIAGKLLARKRRGCSRSMTASCAVPSADRRHSGSPSMPQQRLGSICPLGPMQRRNSDTSAQHDDGHHGGSTENSQPDRYSRHGGAGRSGQRGQLEGLQGTTKAPGDFRGPCDSA